MPKKLLWATVRLPEYPRVRFFVKCAEKKKRFKDVTDQIRKLVIEDVGDESGYCALLRLDSQEKLVWRTTHPSLDETKWQVEFEFGLPAEKWNVYEGPAQA